MSKNDHMTQEKLKYVSCDLGNAKNDHVTQEIVSYVFTYSIWKSMK